MNTATQQQNILGYVLILGVAAIVIALRLRRMSSSRPLTVERLWVVPVIYGAIASFLYWRFPPHGMTILWCAIALALGAAAGWWRGRTIHIGVDPETHALSQRESPFTMVFLLVLIGLRYGARQLVGPTGAVTHMEVMALTDILIAFALGLLSMQRFEMYLRAQKLLGEARKR